MDINIPDELTALAEAHGVDPETVALTAITEAIEQAAISTANEDENVRRRGVLTAVAIELEPAKELIRTRERVLAEPVAEKLVSDEVADDPVEPVRLTRS